MPIWPRHLLYCVALLVAAPAHADWLVGGNPLGSMGHGHRVTGPQVELVADSTGGVFLHLTKTDVVWRITAAGDSVRMWPAAGLDLERPNTSIDLVSVVPDGGGGFLGLLARQDTVPPFHQTLLAVHVASSGLPATDWPDSGIALSAPSAGLAPQFQSLGDGTGGMFVSWSDDRTDPVGHKLFLQHVTAAGLANFGGGAPASDSTGEQLAATLASDGSGGVFIVWVDGRRDDPPGSNTDLYAQRFDAALERQWKPGGVPVCVAPGVQESPQLVGDGTGGSLLAWVDGRLPAVTEIYAQRLNDLGGARWLLDGVPTYPGVRGRETHLTSDGAGGAFVTWTNWGLLDASHVAPDGTVNVDWLAGDFPISFAGVRSDYLSHSFISDGNGGAFLGWADTGFRAIHVGPNGNPLPGWKPEGERLDASGDFKASIHLATDGARGAFASFESYLDYGVPSSPDYEKFLFVQRLLNDGPVAVEVSLVSASATPAGAHLEWATSLDASTLVSIERRAADGAWTTLASALPDGRGRIAFDDPDVTPGARYGWRLAFADGGARRFAGETWLDVPVVDALALAGAWPNPSSGELSVAFALADGSPATLEAFDVSGRRVAHREVGALGAGAHRLRIADGVALAPGAYVLRLTQGGRTFVRRAAVVR